uniref:Protein FAM57B-like n=1 Tax=Saccoglossus kowalevskii TaxID=10224 RepID=A0ABM0LTY6_SACKO|nr:PREDICTED: protein FAM57B-like [Saccoglossus kowalevskii]
MSCSQDILYDSHWLVNTYISFGLPYMLYDIYAMYVVHYHQNPHIWSQGALTKIMHYVKTQPAMILHHLALACLGYPIVMFYRNGKGDFFVGCFFSTELANPFIHLRAIFKQIGWQKTKLEILNGILLLITFFVGRLLLFPIMYHIYGRSKDLTLWEVPFNIPMHCNIGCATILSFQIYWLYLIVGATKRTLKSLFSKDDKAINVNSEGNVVMSVKQD